MADLVDREALLEKFNRDDRTNVNGTLILLSQARMEIETAPAVSAVRADGELISTGMDELYAEFGNCSVCGGDNYIKAKYCNWCGAKMRGAE